MQKKTMTRVQKVRSGNVGKHAGHFDMYKKWTCQCWQPSATRQSPWRWLRLSSTSNNVS